MSTATVVNTARSTDAVDLIEGDTWVDAGNRRHHIIRVWDAPAVMVRGKLRARVGILCADGFTTTFDPASLHDVAA